MKNISLQELKDTLDYNRSTGDFTWKVQRGKRGKIGTVAGSTSSEGYWAIVIKSKNYLAHRLARFYLDGRWPREDVDHKDGNRKNNRSRNLRVAGKAGNALNRKKPSSNTSGFKGVTFHRARGRWYAQIVFQKKHRSLGYYDTPEEASKAYERAAKNLFGAFYRKTTKTIS